MQQSNASQFNINKLGGGSEFKQIVMSLMSGMYTGELVEVVDVSTTGLNPVGFVSVKSLTLRINADNENMEDGIVHNVPYFRLQGGTNAIICDPEIGDIGFCGICSRDISQVKKIRSYSGVNSKRKFDISDAFFFGGWSSKTPEQYIMFTKDGIKMKSKGDIDINGLTIKSDGTLITKDGDVVDKHNHGGVQSGPSNTAPLGG